MAGWFESLVCLIHAIAPSISRSRNYKIKQNLKKEYTYLNKWIDMTFDKTNLLSWEIRSETQYVTLKIIDSNYYVY